MAKQVRNPTDVVGQSEQGGSIERLQREVTSLAIPQIDERADLLAFDERLKNDRYSAEWAKMDSKRLQLRMQDTRQGLFDGS